MTSNDLRQSSPYCTLTARANCPDCSVWGSALANSSDGGISALGGFAFQISLFALEVARLTPGSNVQFETLDDLVVEKQPTGISDDDWFEGFSTLTYGQPLRKVIQAKRTTITAHTKRRVMLNWIVLAIKNQNEISNFILASNSQFNLSEDDPEVSDLALLEYLANSEKKERSLEARVKKISEDDPDLFATATAYIRRRMAPAWIPDIGQNLWTAYEAQLLYQGAQDFVYELRLKQFLSTIAYEILESVRNGKPYTCDDKKRNSLAEEVILQLTEEAPIPNFSLFKKDLHDPALDPTKKDVREIRQLRACNLREPRIWEHFTFSLYYESARRNHLVANKTNVVNAIEETTKENFETVVDGLINNGTDNPFNRLDGTKKSPNSSARNDQIRWGACVYLTAETTEPSRKITWDEREP